MKITITDEQIILNSGQEKDYLQRSNISKLHIRNTIFSLHFAGNDGYVSFDYKDVTEVNGAVPTGMADLIDTLSLPSYTYIHNSDNSFTVYIPAGVPYQLPNVLHTDTNGAVVSWPGMKPFVCADTHSAYFHFIATFGNSITAVVEIDMETTYSTQTLTNVATVVYEKNGAPATLPLTLVIGDTIKITITRTNDALDSLLKLTE